MAEIVMPQLGESVTEGTITRWFKQVGDAVAEDEPLFEVSTDKVDTEVPAPVSGVLSEIRVPEGETVDVGTVLALVGDGTTIPAAPSSGGGEASVGSTGAMPLAPAEQSVESAQPETSTAEISTPELPTPSPSTTAQVSSAPPAAEPLPTDLPTDLSTHPPTGAASLEGEPSSAGGAGSGSGIPPLLSPLVRRLVEQHGIDPASLSGTGIGGRLTRDDVLAEIDRRVAGGATADPDGPRSVSAGAVTGGERAGRAVEGFAGEGIAAGQGSMSPQVSSAALGQSATRVQVPEASSDPIRARSVATKRSPAPRPDVAPLVPGGGERVEQLNKIRRLTGDAMVASKAVAPHAITMVQVDFEGVDHVRRTLRESFQAEEGFSLTYLPFISRAVVDALHEFPHMNSSVGDGTIVLHDVVNLSVAVDLDFQGLLAPVVQDAHDKRLRAIARDITELAARARSRQLSPDDLSGGTFTLSNSGRFGTAMVIPIINQPQVAIMSTDGVSRQPVVVVDEFGNESIGIHSVGNLTLSWDHRAFDGAYAAAFMACVKEILEARDWFTEV